MKYGKYMLAMMVPEWGIKYINFKQLKKLLKRLDEAYEVLDDARSGAGGGGEHDTAASEPAASSRNSVETTSSRNNASAPAQLTSLNTTAVVPKPLQKRVTRHMSIFNHLAQPNDKRSAPAKLTLMTTPKDAVAEVENGHNDDSNDASDDDADGATKAEASSSRTSAGAAAATGASVSGVSSKQAFKLQQLSPEAETTQSKDATPTKVTSRMRTSTTGSVDARATPRLSAPLSPAPLTRRVSRMSRQMSRNSVISFGGVRRADADGTPLSPLPQRGLSVQDRAAIEDEAVQMARADAEHIANLVGITREDFAAFVPLDAPAYEADRAFIELLYDEMGKACDFYVEQYNFFTLRLNEVKLLLHELELETARRQEMARGGSPVKGKAVGRQQVKENIDHMMKQVYRGVQLLGNFRELNATALRKIVKKYRKRSRVGPVVADIVTSVSAEQVLLHAEYYENIERDVEEVYTHAFADGDRKRAMAQLSHDPLETTLWNTCRLGLYIGIIFALLVALFAIIYSTSDISDASYFKASLPTYRALISLNLHMVLWGGCVYAMNRMRVNYAFILQADMSTLVSHSMIHEVAGISSVIVIANMTLLYFSHLDTDDELGDAVMVSTRDAHPWGMSSPSYLHLALFWSLLFVIINPMKMVYQRSRFMVLRTLWRVVRAPFVEVHFADFFYADQLCSMGQVLMDFQWSACLYFTGDFVHDEFQRCEDSITTARWIIPALPYMWRFLQCVRRYKDTQNKVHLVNGCKYLSSIIAVYTALFAAISRGTDSYTALRGIWIVTAVVRTTFTFVWDIFMDWGLGDFSKGAPNWGLRERILLPKNMYFFAIIFNFFLRLSWVVAASTDVFGINIRGEYVKSIVSLVEIVRRSQWNYYRMENEHLNNCGQFRVIDAIPIMISPEGALENGETEDADVMRAAFNSLFKSRVQDAAPNVRAKYAEIVKAASLHATIIMAKRRSTVGSSAEKSVQKEVEKSVHSISIGSGDASDGSDGGGKGDRSAYIFSPKNPWRSPKGAFGFKSDQSDHSSYDESEDSPSDDDAEVDATLLRKSSQSAVKTDDVAVAVTVNAEPSAAAAEEHGESQSLLQGNELK
jgi:hypothetical protein